MRRPAGSAPSCSLSRSRRLRRARAVAARSAPSTSGQVVDRPPRRSSRCVGRVAAAARARRPRRRQRVSVSGTFVARRLRRAGRPPERRPLRLLGRRAPGDRRARTAGLAVALGWAPDREAAESPSRDGLEAQPRASGRRAVDGRYADPEAPNVDDAEKRTAGDTTSTTMSVAAFVNIWTTLPASPCLRRLRRRQHGAVDGLDPIYSPAPDRTSSSTGSTSSTRSSG